MYKFKNKNCQLKEDILITVILKTFQILSVFIFFFSIPLHAIEVMDSETEKETKPPRFKEFYPDKQLPFLQIPQQLLQVMGRQQAHI